MAEGLHGDLSQNQRDRVMKKFREGAVDVLIATDVAARGIDVTTLPTLSTLIFRRIRKATFTASAVPVVQATPA